VIFNPEYTRKWNLLSAGLGELTALPKPPSGIGKSPQRGVQEEGKAKRGRNGEEGISGEKRREQKEREGGNWRGKEGTEGE